MAFENTQKINRIEVGGRARMFCPMGDAWYTGRFAIRLVNPVCIPDYCDVDRFFHELDGDTCIIEDAVASVYDFICEQVKGGHVTVTCAVNDAGHGPVTVEREGEA